MNSFIGLALAVLCFAFFTTSDAALAQKTDDGPVVKISSGRIRGLSSGTTAVYKGIPFAQPPIGPLRWQPPQPVTPWQGIRDAKTPGNSCMQQPYRIGGFSAGLALVYGASYQPEPLKVSEDCLYLNVWTPTSAARRSLPVMVWIHGGSNVSGSGSQSMYDGAALAAQGVIIVTVNYRLGILGFFSHPELTAQSPHHSSGNYALLDQLAALKWVRQNIAKFGGDARNVTIFGESAGSVNITQLMTSPHSAGLFQRVIAESGPPFGLGPAQKLADAEALGAEIGAAAQPNSKSTLKALLALSPAALDELANKVIQARPKDTASSSAAVVDGWVLPLAPQKAFATGAIQKVDLLIGLNGREFSVFRIAAEMAAKRAGNKDERKDDPGAALAGLAETVRPLYGSQTNEAVSSYLGEIRANPGQGADQAMNDMLAACPIGAVATLVNAKGKKVFVYEFNRTVPGKGEANLGAFHSLELPYVFGAFDDLSWRWLPVTDVDRTLAASIQSYWINFAKTGNPNAPGLPSWPVWNNNDELFLEITKDGKIAAQRKFSPHSCDLAPVKLKERLSK